MTIVGLDYGFVGQTRIDEVVGGAPYGATTIAGGDAAASPARSNARPVVISADASLRQPTTL